MTPADLRTARKALGLSAEGFARVVGATGRTVRRWEAGSQDIPPRAIAIVDMLTQVPAAAEAARQKQRASDRRYKS